MPDDEEAAQLGEMAAEGGELGAEPIVVTVEEEAAMDDTDEPVGEDLVLGVELAGLVQELLEVALLPLAGSAGGLAVRDPAPVPALLGQRKGGLVRFF